MYKVGKYDYKSKRFYELLTFSVFVIFIICGDLLFILKNNMNEYIFYFTLAVDFLMIFHLMFRLLFSRGFIENYIFNEY